MFGVRARSKSGWRDVATAIGGVSLVIVAAGLASLPVASEGIRRAAAAASATSSSLATASSTTVAAASTSAVAAAAPSSSAVAAKPAPKLLDIGQGTRVLVFGDSFVAAGFQQRLAKLVEARGGVFFADSWTSSSTSSWDKASRLAALLQKAKPDVVIVALGANEVFMPSPEALSGHVKNIVARLGDRACVWSSPPLWKGETGIVKVERENSAPCSFFDPGVVAIPKGKDGIHPTMQGGEIWADALWGSMVSPAPPTIAAAASGSSSAPFAPIAMASSTASASSAPQ